MLLNVVDKPLKLKIYLVSSRDLVPKDRATCIIASRPNFFITNTSLSGLINLQVGFDVLVLSVSSYIYKLAPPQCNQHSSFQKIFITSSKQYLSASKLKLCEFKCSYSFQSSRKLLHPSILSVSTFLQPWTQQRLDREMIGTWKHNKRL